MSDKKRRLPIYTGPTGVEVPLSEELLSYQQDYFIAGNCFRFYAFDNVPQEDGSSIEGENMNASVYFLRGLHSLHQAYFAGIADNGYEDNLHRALGYFQQAWAAKSDYFCARQAAASLLAALGEEVSDEEEYALSRTSNPHPDKPCHLLHAGFYSASDLSKLEERLKEERK
mgnify:CR=1 FL=1